MGFHVEVGLANNQFFWGYEAPARETGRSGSVLIIHDWFGLNEAMRAHTERFSELGFHALAIDLYAGRVASDADTARRLSAELREDHVMDVITSATRHMRSRPNATDKVGLAGFCLGGAVAVAAAGRVPGLSGAVTFCGLPPSRFIEVDRIQAPVMGHYGLRDPLLPVARPRAWFDSLAATGKRAMFHAYDAGHAFMRSGSQAYQATLAELARQRTLGFFREVLC